MRFLTRGVPLAAMLLAACGGGDSPAPAVPPTASISASPLVVSNHATSTLTWESVNATACAASGAWTGVLPSSGTQATSAISSGATYSVTCSGAGGTSGTTSVTINVVPTVVIAATPVVVTAGGTSALSWSSFNAVSCTASGAWTGSQSASGTQSTGALTKSSTYTLTCSGPGGTSEPSSVTLNVLPVPAATVTLTANPKAVPAGGAAVLTWSSSNATSCSASGGWNGVEPSSGTLSTGALAATTSYSMTCTGPGGISSPTTVTIVSGVVSLTPVNVSLTPSQTQQFKAAVPGGGSATWSVDGIAGGNSAVGLISSAGVFAPGTGAGSHTVTAVSSAYPVLSGNAIVAVTGLAGMYTYHNDTARDGVNSEEYALTPASVSPSTFGKLFSCVLDGAVYGQPLWISGLVVKGASHNVVVLATEHDSVFAVDADAAPCVQLWTASLIDASHGGSTGESPVPSGIAGYLVGRGAGDIAPEVGVTGTPVIDPGSNTLYVVSKSVTGDGIFYQRLHAIDMTTGEERSGSPTTIEATYPGAGDGGTVVTFNAQTENQRTGLALVDGIVYVAWSSHEDVAPWYGWVMGYRFDGSSFTQAAVFNAAPDAQEGGIWMGGGAPASDENGALYLVTGNGNFDATSDAAPNSDYGDSLLQLSGALSLSQYFTPSDQASDAAGDKDFGAGGAAVLADLAPGPSASHLLLCGGKDGSLYVLNRDLLGGFGDSAAVQKIDFGYRIFATGAYWNSSYYLSGDKGPLVQYALDPGTALLSLSAVTSHVYGFGGSTPSISASATQNGIVWSVDNAAFCIGTASACGPSVLYAHDASNALTELWDSSTNASDAAGYAIKFSVPTVANGKVYLGTRGNNAGGVTGSTSVPGELDVYGLR